MVAACELSSISAMILAVTPGWQRIAAIPKGQGPIDLLAYLPNYLLARLETRLVDRQEAM